MPRAHLYRPLIDKEGNRLVGAKVTISEAAFDVPLGQTMYVADTGSTSLSNPFIADDGLLNIYLNDPQRLHVRVEATVGEGEGDEGLGVATFSIYLDALPVPDEIVTTAVPLKIINEAEDGKILAGTDIPGEAEWIVYDDSGTGLTPEVTVFEEDFVPTPSPVPVGWDFTHLAHWEWVDNSPQGDGNALNVYQNAPVDFTTTEYVTSPIVTLPERGTFSCWVFLDLQSPPEACVNIEIMRVGSSEALVGWRLVNSGPDAIPRNAWWQVLTELPAGAYTVKMSLPHLVAEFWSDVQPHYFNVTDFLFIAGGQIPVHYHEGTAARTLVIGTGAEVTGVDATAVGDQASAEAGGTAVGSGATATGTDSVAVGHLSSAAGGSQALGAEAKAVGASIAMGYHTTANAGGSVNAIALGSLANSTSLESIAIGKGASATAARAAAIGSGAIATNVDAIALGSGAAAIAPRSVAIGHEAVANIADAIVLGVDSDTVVVPGDLVTLGDIHHQGDNLGFFGTPPVVRPIIDDTDDGSPSISSLMSYLHDMGLIQWEALTGGTPPQPKRTGLMDDFNRADPGSGFVGDSVIARKPYTYQDACNTTGAPANPGWAISTAIGSGVDSTIKQNLADSQGIFMAYGTNTRCRWAVQCRNTAVGGGTKRMFFYIKKNTTWTVFEFSSTQLRVLSGASIDGLGGVSLVTSSAVGTSVILASGVWTRLEFDWSGDGLAVWQDGSLIFSRVVGGGPFTPAPFIVGLSVNTTDTHYRKWTHLSASAGGATDW